MPRIRVHADSDRQPRTPVSYTHLGVKIPVLFRPWHEHSGSWFWWGEKLCTPEEYKALWHMTVDTLQALSLIHIFFPDKGRR